MKRSLMAEIMRQDFDSMLKLHEDAQKEYTLRDEAFDNFNRLAAELQLSREKVLWVYLKKHLDAVLNHINGQETIREPIENRIFDCVVYLMILRGMLKENKFVAEMDKASDEMLMRAELLDHQRRAMEQAEKQ